MFRENKYQQFYHVEYLLQCTLTGTKNLNKRKIYRPMIMSKYYNISNTEFHYVPTFQKCIERCSVERPDRNGRILYVTRKIETRRAR